MKKEPSKKQVPRKLTQAEKIRRKLERATNLIAERAAVARRRIDDPDAKTR